MTEPHPAGFAGTQPTSSAPSRLRRRAQAGTSTQPTSSAGTGGHELIEAGRVGRPHGLDGSFHVTRPVAHLLAGREEIHVAGRVERIERRAGTDERPILRLAGHAGREAAEALRGAQLAIPAGEAPGLQAGEYWAHELAGCAVFDGQRHVGEVRRMLPLPSCEVLDVARAEGGELLVPMVSDAIRSVDVVARRIDVDLAFLGE